MKGVFALTLYGIIGISVVNAQEAGYRYQSDKVTLESAENRGLSFDDVAPKTLHVPPRSLPLLQFAQEARKKQPGTIEKQQIEVTLTKSQNTQVETGFPFPEGGIFDPQNILIRDMAGMEIPAQVYVTTFWPDASIKWALLQFSAKEKFSVEFGNSVQRQIRTSPLHVSHEGDIVTVDTGKIRATIHTKKFNLIQEVVASDKLSGSFTTEGVRLVSAEGTIYSSSQSPPEKFDIEQEGTEKIVIRVEGAYANQNGEKLMRYVTRLAFRRDSSQVEIIHRHINDALAQEFTDFQSLEMPFNIGTESDSARLLLPDGKETAHAEKLRVFQEDESQSILTENDKTKRSGSSPGAIEVLTHDGRVAVAIQDFWQRWPKALGFEDDQVIIDLLPKQPSSTYGNKLPAHLIYPFVNGNYRMKWGMSFTERVTLDFDNPSPLAQFSHSINTPSIAIIPSSWYATTKALGIMAAKQNHEFEEWDDFFERGYQSQIQRQISNREYGFMNYGDWFGERGRNWGNNEYDIAHAFFMQFARTGKPEYYRLALAAARHQADVDIVHAYPDPLYIGANPPHSIGHTGMATHTAQYATWSHKYDSHTYASNGHTWAEGMTEAWFLAGDPTVMESTLLLGEHITWAIAPGFQISVAYPRSAGWSLRAILAIYRATGDPEYLKAADSIARSAIEAQDASGIWVRGYTQKKSNTSTGAMIPEDEAGISNFQLGLTLAALTQYYDVTKNQEVKEAVLRGVRLLATAWPGSGGWPYDIRRDGSPGLARPKQSSVTNILNAESIAYMGMLENNPDLIRIAEEVLLNTLFYEEPVARRQKIGLLLRSAQAVLGSLQSAYQNNHSQWPGFSPQGKSNVYFKGISHARKFDVRGPGTLTFLLKTSPQSPIPSLTLYRSASNSSEEAQNGKVRIMRHDGEVVQEEEILFTEKNQEFLIKLPEGLGEIFSLEIEEPDRGIWNLDSGFFSGVLMKASPGLLLSGLSNAKYQLKVPEQSEHCTISLTAPHHGGYGAALLDENGQVLGVYREVTENTPTGKLSIALGPENRGKVLYLAVWASGDLQIEIRGASPWLARNSDEYFDPEHLIP